MTTAYYDTAFLFKLLFSEVGTEVIQAHASRLEAIACCEHGRIEFASICHRKIREGVAPPADMGEVLAQLRADAKAGGIRWLPISETVLAQAEAGILRAPADVCLRASDALHLACAAENGFPEVYSNDRHLLSAAPLFGLRGVNLIDQV